MSETSQQFPEGHDRLPHEQEQILEREESQPEPLNNPAEGITDPGPGDAKREEDVSSNKPEDQSNEGYGKFNEKGEYEFTVDIDDLATQLDIPRHILEKAAEMGIPPDTLLMAKENSHTSKRLRNKGLEWGIAPQEYDTQLNGNVDTTELGWPQDDKGKDKNIGDMSSDERQALKARLEQIIESGGIGETGVDPIKHLSLIGIKKDLEVADIADRIEKDPVSLRKTLRRPSHREKSARFMDYFGVKFGHLILAYMVHRKELKERVEPGPTHLDGRLNLGIPRIKRNLKYIKQQDEDIRVIRNKLGRLNRHEYLGEDMRSARRDLAEFIYRAQQRDEALRTMRKLHHPDVYKHGPVKKALGEYSKEKAQEAH